MILLNTFLEDVLFFITPIFWLHVMQLPLPLLSLPSFVLFVSPSTSFSLLSSPAFSPLFPPSLSLYSLSLPPPSPASPSLLPSSLLPSASLLLSLFLPTSLPYLPQPCLNSLLFSFLSHSFSLLPSSPLACVRSLFAQTVVAMTLTCIVECVVPCTGRSLPPT